jgi:hypothetical protein
VFGGPLIPFGSHSFLFGSHPMPFKSLVCFRLGLIFEQRFQHQSGFSGHVQNIFVCSFRMEIAIIVFDRAILACFTSEVIVMVIIIVLLGLR